MTEPQNDTMDDFFDDELELEAAAEQPAAEVGAGEAERTTGEDTAAASAGGSDASAAEEATDAAPAADVPSAPASTASTASSEPAAAGPTPPPFWMVLVITAIALVLGVIIGYLLGSSAALASLESMQSQAQAEQTTDAADSSAYELPEGHPQLEVDTDGTAHVADGSDASDGSASDSSAATDAAGTE